MPSRINFPSFFNRSAKPLPAKESTGGPSGKETSKLQNTPKGDPRETAKGKNEAGEVKKERVTLRQLLDKERQEELEEAHKAKNHQLEVKEERKSAGSQAPESLRTSQPNPRVRMKRRQFDKHIDAPPTIPEEREIVYELKKTMTEDHKKIYREVHPNFPVRPEGPENKFGFSTLHEDYLLPDKRLSKFDPSKPRIQTEAAVKRKEEADKRIAALLEDPEEGPSKLKSSEQSPSKLKDSEQSPSVLKDSEQSPSKLKGSEKGSNKFVQTFSSAMQSFSKTFSKPFTRSTDRN